MDPETAWANLTLHLEQRDRPAVADDADALIEWLEKGGFAPTKARDFGGRDGLLRTLRIARKLATME